MNTTTNIAFQVQVQHDYFKDYGAHSLLVRPSSQTISDFSRINGKFFYSVNGFGVILLDERLKIANPKFKDLNMGFVLEAKSPQFFNYTQIDFIEGNILYADSETIEDGICRFQSLPLREDRFTIDVPFDNHPSRICLLELYNSKGDIIKNEHLLNQWGNSVCSIDLSDEPDGAYKASVEFVVEGQENPNSYSYSFYKSRDYLWTQPLAVFHWLNSDSARDSIGSPSSYSLKFETRKTYWKYYMIKKSWLNSEDEEIEIPPVKIEGEKVQFYPTKNGILPNGDAADFYTSSHPIPFKEKPDWMVMMKTNNSDREIPLPYASFDLIGKGKIKGLSEEKEADFSNIYVYL